MTHMDNDRSVGSEQARALFMQAMLFAYRDAVKTVAYILEDSKSPARGAWRDWYRSLDPAAQAQILDIVRETVYSTMFRMLVLLDGMTGGYPVRDVPSEYAVYLQVYENHAAMRADRPTHRVRLNWLETFEPLHDEFLNVLRESGAQDS